MDSNTNCNLCRKPIFGTKTTFTCNHNLCSLCLSRLLIMNEFSGLENLRTVKIYCNCRLGEYSVPINDLSELLTKGIISKTEDTCIMHKDETAKNYCPKCEQWFCLECYNKHIEGYSDHQTRNYIIEDLNRCHLHIYNETSFYCKTCKKEICKQCCEEDKHKNHIILPFTDYFSKKRIKRLNSGYTSYQRLDEKIDEIYKNYLVFYEKEVKEKEDMINSLIEQLTKMTKTYKEEMEANKEKVHLMLDSMRHAFKIYYNNPNDTKQTVFYYKLSKEYKKDFTDITFLSDESEELKNIQDMINKYSLRSHLKYKFIFNHFTFVSTATLKGHKDSVLSLASLKQGSLLASGSQDHTIRIWDLNNYERLNILNNHSDAVFTLCGLNNILLSGSRDDRIIQWDIDKMDLKSFAFGHSIHIHSLIRLLNGKLLSGARDESIKVWEYKDKTITCIKALKGHENTVLSIAEMNRDRIVSGSADSKIKIWDMNKYKCIKTIESHSDSVNGVVLLFNGNIASCSSDKTIKMFNDIGYALVGTLIGHSEGVYALTQLEDGRLASGSCDFSICLWDIQDMVCTQKLKGHTNTVFSLIQLKDGRLISGSGDNTIRIWN